MDGDLGPLASLSRILPAGAGSLSPGFVTICDPIVADSSGFEVFARYLTVGADMEKIPHATPCFERSKAPDHWKPAEKLNLSMPARLHRVVAIPQRDRQLP